MDRIVDLIQSKRRGDELGLADFERLINGYTLNEISDAQMGALLMAGTCTGFSDAEATVLTTAMLRCGERLELPEGMRPHGGLLLDRRRWRQDALDRGADRSGGRGGGADDR